jgi:hypothetical protein
MAGCEAAFANSSNLRRHVRSHLDEKIYVCHRCNRHFARNVSLKAHNAKFHAKDEEEEAEDEDESGGDQADKKEAASDPQPNATAGGNGPDGAAPRRLTRRQRGSG